MSFPCAATFQEQNRHRSKLSNIIFINSLLSAESSFSKNFP
jgi:hypothetical protein